MQAIILNRAGIRYMLIGLLLTVLSLQLTNRSIFVHSHLLPDGRVVTHAHPYDKGKDDDPYKSHHHSLAQFYLLSSLELLFLSFAALTSLIALSGYTRNYLPTFEGHLDPSLHPCNGRSPPCITA